MTWRKRLFLPALCAALVASFFDAADLAFAEASGERSNRPNILDQVKQWELNDLRKDPREINNIFNDPASHSLRQTLQAELKRLQAVLGDDAADVGDHPRSGRKISDKYDRR